MTAFRQRLFEMLDEHSDDNEVLKEESYFYILPAIAMYKTMKDYYDDPLSLFRNMWLNGAHAGAEYLRDKAKDESFIKEWISNVTPKNCDAGAFLFKIEHFCETETEYHVLRCPYVQMCREYNCFEIVTVFCDSDDISFGNIHPKLKWGRTKTIGRGDDICNFKFTIIK